MQEISNRGLVLLGCGKMGSAMLAGWLENGLSASAVWVQDPHPSEWLQTLAGLNLNSNLPPDPAIVLVAVKPQIMAQALPILTPFGNGTTVFLSVAAGISINSFETMLGGDTPIIRTMPNLPAAIGKGITALVGNQRVNDPQMALAETLMAAIGQTVRLESEAQIDAVTGVSGSGPGFVFYMIEALAAAGQAEGLPEDLAMKLAKATVFGAGAMAVAATESPAELRANVTSPGGTTKAGLEVLMNADNGLSPLIRSTVAAAAKRSRELSS